MIATPSSIPLTRRLVTWYWVFSLAGLLLCILTTIGLAYQGDLLNWLPLAAAVPIAALIAGAVVLQHLVKLYGLIEAQLLKISANPASPRVVTESITSSDPAAQGWNALLSRLEARESLLQLEHKLSSSVAGRRDARPMLIVHTLSDGVALTEQDGTILLGNRALAGLVHAKSAEELIGQNLLTLLKVDSAHNAASLLQTLSSSSVGLVTELRRTEHLKDGVLRLSRQDAIDTDSPLQRYIWTIRDVTQSALIEEARHQFLAVATHELRTPLGNIKAYAETLSIQDGIDVERQKEFCNIINAEATRLGRFVDEMLSISQIESGALTLDLQPTELERLLQDVIENVQPLMAQKQLSFETRLPPKFPTLRLDKGKMQSALVNLLGNAAKYTPEGGRVWFEVHLNASTVDFCVRDSGIGIAEDEVPRIFERFFRSGDPRVRSISGNGLGLTFTHSVVQLHGGRLSVDSRINEGTLFTASLPLPVEGNA